MFGGRPRVKLDININIVMYQFGWLAPASADPAGENYTNTSTEAGPHTRGAVQCSSGINKLFALLLTCAHGLFLVSVWC